MARGFWAIILSLFWVLESEAGRDSAREDGSHSLHAVLFEAYLMAPPAPDEAYYDVELSSAEFPVKFSALFVPLARPQRIELPPDVRLPDTPMFLDIYTFKASRSQLEKKRRLSRSHPVLNLEYSVTFLSWTEERYTVELAGRYDNWKFKKVLIDGKIDRTKMIMVTQTANRLLFIALTPAAAIGKQGEIVSFKQPGIRFPVSTSQPLPAFPSELSKAQKSGKVVIQCIITAEGTVSPDNFVLLSVPIISSPVTVSMLS